MRKKMPEHKDVITKRKFAFFPKEIEGFKVWFEFYVVNYIYEKNYSDKPGKWKLRKLMLCDKHLLKGEPDERVNF
jgi:hypothetical protein